MKLPSSERHGSLEFITIQVSFQSKVQDVTEILNVTCLCDSKTWPFLK